jgi:hypothetical protein
MRWLCRRSHEDEESPGLGPGSERVGAQREGREGWAAEGLLAGGEVS